MAITLFMIFLLALPFFLFIILLKQSTSNNGNFNHLPPGPPGLPFIGHLRMLMLDNSLLPHIFLWKPSQNYGPLMSLRFGFKPTLVVSSAKMAEAVLKTHDLDFCSRPSLRDAMRLSYNALDLAFSPYTDYLKEMRKLCVVHLFSRVQKYRPIREDQIGRLVEKISQLSVDSNPVNLSEAMMCLSSSIICRIGFGKRYDDGAERSRFHELLKETEAMLSCFSFSDYFPFMGWVDRFTGFLTQDLIDVLPRIRMDRDFPFDLTIDHIKAILMNVFIAGTDTAAATVIWVMSALMKNPECLKKTQAEFCPERFLGNSIDYKGLNFEFLPFGAGRRVCPGMRIGVAEVELVIANHLYKFDWEMPTGMNKEDLDFDAVPV
ncbi:hypothetical protein E1A91_D10G230200v1 [Gossypium mustelinum]|uniref:Cytochrome P450 n=1 Tax=Gossypium mustelinum TaxID=34275 RepID=A0A5D2TAE9_GOSMU|nr:hypothetical protein E1A91_D10G230200v1 [Gossypium mustelinum]